MERFVKTYRDITSPVLMSTDGEGDNKSGNVWLIGMIFALIFIGGFDWLMVICHLPVKAIIIISLILFGISCLIFPFNLSKKLKNYHELQNSQGSDFTKINKIVGFKDNLILWNQTIGYVLQCVPNHYINYNNYANDFKGFLELFSQFSIDIDYIKDTDPVPYIDIDKVNIYKNKRVAFERINLARYADNLLSKSSKVFVLYITVTTNQGNLDKLDKQLEEMKYSNYKRVFSKIKILNPKEDLEVLSRVLGLIITEDNLITSKVNSNINDKNDRRFKIYRKET